jgi:hypothetical protein
MHICIVIDSSKSVGEKARYAYVQAVQGSSCVSYVDCYEPKTDFAAVLSYSKLPAVSS